MIYNFHSPEQTFCELHKILANQECTYKGLDRLVSFPLELRTFAKRRYYIYYLYIFLPPDWNFPFRLDLTLSPSSCRYHDTPDCILKIVRTGQHLYTVYDSNNFLQSVQIPLFD